MSGKRAKARRREQRLAEWHTTVRPTLDKIVRNLRRELAMRIRLHRSKYPKMALPCSTCAFRSSTDSWEGYENTVINLCAALVDDRPFYCHADMPLDPVTREYQPIAGRETPVCAGWLELQSNPPLDLDDIAPRPILEAFGAFVRDRYNRIKMPDDPALEGRKTP